MFRSLPLRVRPKRARVSESGHSANDKENALNTQIFRTVVLTLCCGAASPIAADDFTRRQADAALKKAIQFFHKRVSAEGGYLWRYSADLSHGEGEGQAKRTTIWVQPPGTPTIGQVVLTAYQRTGDTYFLDVARDTAYVLVKGQLRSGGWDYRIELAPEDRARYAYRSDGRQDGRNVTTLDDDTTQASLRFLMRIDQQLQFHDQPIHSAVNYSLDCLLKAQYPNGAWPQRFSDFPDPSKYPVKQASCPETWSRTHPNHNYRGYYTLNDNTLADMITIMVEATEIYGRPRFRAAAERAGGFLLLAQMPAPQPAWAQQYNALMQPAWARRFEPPAVTGGESQGALRALMYLYRQTGDDRYLEPIPRAIDYLERSTLPDGRLARFYELRTNRPLYFTKKYQLTYQDDDLPTHYGFQVGSSLSRIRAEYGRLRATPWERPNMDTESESIVLSASLAAKAKAAAVALDDRGAWVEAGRLRFVGDGPTKIIDCRTFVGNVDTLSQFVAAGDKSNE